MVQVQRPQGRQRERVVAAGSNGRLVWTCDVCSEPVADRAGYVQVDSGEAGRKTRRVRLLADRQNTMVERVNEYQSPVRWLALHRECDPDLSGDCYWIAVERCRTWRQFMHWTAHLMGKSWLTGTDWRDLLASLGTPA